MITTEHLCPTCLEVECACADMPRIGLSFKAGTCKTSFTKGESA